MLPQGVGGNPARANVHRNTHNRSKDVPPYKDTLEERADWMRILEEIETWLSERACKYTVDLNPINRIQHCINNGFFQQRIADDQEILWSLLQKMFGRIPRFGKALRSKNPANQFYASNVWDRCYRVLNPQDDATARLLLQKQTALLPLFDGNFEPWSSAIQKYQFEMEKLKPGQNEAMLIEQMKAVMTAWVAANAVNPISRSTNWNIFLSSYLPSKFPPGFPPDLEQFLDAGTEYERQIWNGPEYATMEERPGAAAQTPAPPAAPTAGAPAGASVPAGFAYSGTVGQQNSGQQSGGPRPPCSHCGLTNHDSEDCKLLASNSEMWCGRCNSDTHWEAKCRFKVADQRTKEKSKGSPPGKGGKNQGGKSGGGKGGSGKSGSGPKGPLLCHVCQLPHLVGGCKAKTPVNRFVNKVVSSGGKKPTAEDIEEFINELMLAGSADSGTQVAMIAKQVLDKAEKERKERDNPSSSMAAQGSSTDPVLAEMQSLRNTLQAQQYALQSSGYYQGRYGVPNFSPSPSPAPNTFQLGAAMSTMSLDRSVPGQAFQGQGFPMMPMATPPPSVMYGPQGPYAGRSNGVSGPPGFGQGGGMPHVNLMAFSVPEPEVEEIPLEFDTVHSVLETIAEDQESNENIASVNVEKKDEDVEAGAPPDMPPETRSDVLASINAGIARLERMRAQESSSSSNWDGTVIDPWSRQGLLMIPKLIVLWICGISASRSLTVFQLLENERQAQRDSEPRTADDLRRLALIMLELGDSGLNNVPTTPGRALLATFPDQSTNDLWLVADTGANRHYISREDWLCNVRPCVSMIYGVGNARIQSKKRGIFQGLLGCFSGTELPFSGDGTHVPNSNTSLFSIPMAARNGHTIIFEGNPAAGRHGIKIAGTNEWVPFHWDPSTQLWWIRVKRDPNAAYGSTAPDVVPQSAAQGGARSTNAAQAWAHEAQV